MFSQPSLTRLVTFKEQIQAACSWLPTLVLFLQTRGSGASQCEVKHLDQISMQPQLWLDFSELITIRSLCSCNYFSMQRKSTCLAIVKDSTAYDYLNIIDINIILITITAALLIVVWIGFSVVDRPESIMWACVEQNPDTGNNINWLLSVFSNQQ